jgi:hypothetical protein
VLFEHRVPGVGPIDLVVTGHDTLTAAVEIKFPRDPRERNSADTMTLGELLNDFYRLARVQADERWALQVIGSRLGAYLARRNLIWAVEVGDTKEMAADLTTHVRATTRQAMRAADGHTAVRARCTFARSGGDLKVLGYAVTRSAQRLSSSQCQQRRPIRRLSGLMTFPRIGREVGLASISHLPRIWSGRAEGLSG